MDLINPLETSKNDPRKVLCLPTTIHSPTPDASLVSRHAGSFLCFSARDSAQDIALYLVVLPPNSSLGCSSFPDSPCF